MAYKYVNGVFEVTTEIRDGFKRFHSMNAQHAKFVLNDNDNIPRFIVWQFVSYDTNIIQVVRDMKNETWIVSCNDNPFGYSTSTTRQVTRWIKEHFMPFPFTALDVREAYKYCQSITPNIATYHLDNITFEFRSSFSFKHIWR